MVAFRHADTSGRTTGLLLRCVLYSLLALGLIIVDKRYDHLGRIRRVLSVVAYPVQIAVASPFEGWDWFRESVTTGTPCAPTRPSSSRSCVWRNSACSAMKRWRQRASACVRCATAPWESRTGSSSAM